MSNPVTDAQVEDVLSSIRRLVSSDVRSDGQDVEDTEQTSTEVPSPGVDRLVLSPALRVAAEQDDVSDEVDSSADRAPDDTQTKTQAGSDEEPSVDDEIEPVSGDNEDQVAIMAIEDDETEPEPDSLSSDINPEALRFLFRARKRPTLETEPDQDETATARAGKAEVAQEPEIAATDAVKERPPLLLTNPQPSVEEVDDGAGDREKDQHPTASDDPVVFRSSDHTGDAVPADGLTARIAAVESAIAQTSDQWEPDDDGADEYAGTAVERLEWEDHHDTDDTDEELDQAGQAAASTDDPIEIEAELIELAKEPQEDLTSADVELDLDSDLADDTARDDLAEVALEAKIVEREESVEEEPVPTKVEPTAVADVQVDETPIAEPEDEGFEASLEAEVAELEESIDDELPPTDMEAEAVEMAKVADDDAAHADASEEGAVDLQSDLADADPDASDSDEDAVLDEEALRELIGDIVHQELNGKLGERITHNVRKLVRRELQRALASQDLS